MQRMSEVGVASRNQNRCVDSETKKSVKCFPFQVFLFCLLMSVIVCYTRIYVRLVQ